MTDSPASRTTQPSEIAGVEPLREPHRAFHLLRRAASSLTLKFAVLIAIFIALPFLVYNQFDKSDARLRDLVTAGLRHQSWLSSQGLKPALDRPDKMPGGELAAMLAKYDSDGTKLQLMRKPAKGAVGHFY